MQDVKVQRSMHCGHIVLNKPPSLNAISLSMANDIEVALDHWRDDQTISIVIIEAEGPKAFCAGGDIVALYEHGKRGDFAYGQNYWRQEYQMNYKIATYPKPVVTFMQGFVMGGGVGVGCHASNRIVGQSTKIAMPECGIGLITDAGGSHLLGSAPNNFGRYLGLTGARMEAGDAILAGFADHYISEDQWAQVKQELIDKGTIDHITKFAEEPPNATLYRNYLEIKNCFEPDQVPSIVARLQDIDAEFANKTVERMKASAPLSLACSLQAIISAKSMSLFDALAQEYRFTYRALEHTDFLEGTRAQVIDRDFAPKWQHENFDVPLKDIEVMFAPLGAAEFSIA